jgi:hypothetical protein
MLAANETVAEHFHWMKVPFLYRVHEDPDAEKLLHFVTFVANFGYVVRGKGNTVHPKALQSLLEEIKGTKEETVISTVLLRSMKQARYDANSLGHFGLSAEFYSHFTSPIRRYPDLIIHRVIREVLELGGAMKNVLAIAAGVCDGLQLGANARAALLTRGLAEMSRLGLALGAQPQTFLGLATLGDLILTATGDLSRNRRVGLGLAKGQTLEQLVKGLGHVAEGVPTAPALLGLAQQHRVDVPITESVCRLLQGEWSAQEAIAQLMSREPRDERSL